MNTIDKITASPISSTQDLQAKFHKILGNTAEDLEVNRQGHMSERQKIRLTNEMKKGKVLFGGVILVVVSVLLLALFSYLQDIHEISDPIDQVGRFIGLAWFIIPVLAVFAIWKATNNSIPLWQRSIASITGTPVVDFVRLKLFRLGLSGHRMYSLKINKEEFNVDEKLARLFEEHRNKKYRIFYPENSGYILSVEVMD